MISLSKFPGKCSVTSRQEIQGLLSLSAKTIYMYCGDTFNVQTTVSLFSVTSSHATTKVSIMGGGGGGGRGAVAPNENIRGGGTYRFAPQKK